MYALGNVEEEQRTDPSFRIPPAAFRESLEPGDLAEIMLLSEGLAEPSWVQVVDILGPGVYGGIFESGEAVEFGPEHVADVLPREELPPRMGAAKPDPFEALRRPPAQRPPDPFEVLLRPPPPKPPSPFEVLRRPPGTPPPAPAAPAPRPGAAAEPKKGFFERFFTRKPKFEVKPIPPAERRAPAPGPFPELPAPMPATRAPGPVEPSPLVIIPPAPTGLVPQEEPAAVPPPAPSAIIQRESRAPAVLVPDAFTLLAPSAEAPPPRGLVIPAAPELPASVSHSIFEILAPPGPGGLAPAAPTSAFDILVPPSAPAGGLAPLEARTGGMSIFDVLAPAPGTLAPFDPAALDPFTMVAPPVPEAPYQGPLVPQAEFPPGEQQWTGWGAPPTFQPVEPYAQKKGKPRKTKERPSSPPWTRKGKNWVMPSPEDVIPWIEHIFDMKRLWDLVRRDRMDEEFRQMVIEQDDTGEPALIPFETITYTGADWVQNVAEFFEIPDEVMDPFYKEIERKEAREEDWSDVEEEIVGLFQEYYLVIMEAFSRIQPKDIPGNVVVESYYDQIVLAYWEGLSDEDRRRIEREKQFLREEMEKAKEERKKALRRIWGRMPTVEELVPFIEDKFDIDALWKEVRRTRKTKAFKDQFNDDEQAYIELENVAVEGPTFYDELGFYFSLPPEVLALYLDRKPPLEGLLWEEVLAEFLDRISFAFGATQPRDIPGTIVVAEPEGGRGRVLMYIEEQESE